MFPRADGVALQREDPVLSSRDVRVRYEILNDRRTPVRGHVAFPLPLFPARPNMANPGFMPEHADFTLTVNGTPQAIILRVWATLGGRATQEGRHRPQFLDFIDVEIVTAFNSEFRGFANHYAIANGAKPSLGVLELVLFAVCSRRWPCGIRRAYGGRSLL